MVVFSQWLHFHKQDVIILVTSKTGGLQDQKHVMKNMLNKRAPKIEP